MTAPRPVAATNKPLLTVIRPDTRAAGPRLGFVAAFDLLGQSIGVYNLSGTLLHRTGAFRGALEQPEVATLINTAVATIANQVESSWRGQAFPSPVTLRAARLVVRASLYQPSSEAMVLVCIEAPRGSQDVLTDEELVRRFGMTPTQLRVARLLAAGESNKVIATTLGVSGHTARHHTEHVFRKLGVCTRAAVASKLMPQATQ